MIYQLIGRIERFQSQKRRSLPNPTNVSEVRPNTNPVEFQRAQPTALLLY
jgi:hypothetical protein